MTIYDQGEDGHWYPSPTAQGPFTGLQGGGVAALMVAELEQIAQAEDLGLAYSASIEFWKPTPLGKLTTEPSIVRKGRSSSVLTNRVSVAGKQTASASVCFIRGSECADVVEPEAQPFDPATLAPLAPRNAPQGGAWLMDNFEVRPAPDGTIWFSHKDEIVPGMTSLASVLGPADWTHGLARPKSPILADPNVNLQVALSRAPVGEFIGIRPKTTWTQAGIGLGEGALFDEAGPIGRVAMSAVLVAFGGG